MKWNTRCLLFGLAIVLVIVVCFQVIEVTNQYYPSTTRISAIEHAQNIFKRSCSDAFPVPDGVRIFSDGREVRHLAFLKVHKAASGTATSIFFRFGVTRGLTFVLPKYLNIVSSTETIQDKFIHPRLNKSFDIMTSHVIYNRIAFESFMPKDTVYIGILRDPYQQFKSSMNYMAPKYVYNISKVDPIQQYLQNPSKYETAKTPRHSWINNRQAAEFGVADEIINRKNATAMNAYVRKLDQEFNLVIIAEYFDESIVLLRRMLNWKLQDILYRRLHIRGWDRKITLPQPYDRRLYRKHAFADNAMYDFFFARLWKQAKQSGDDFFDEVLHYKEVREEVDDFCKVYPNITSVYKVPRSHWNEALSIDKDFCKMMFSEEEDWVKIIAEKQYGIKKNK